MYKVFVGGLPFSTTDDELKELFAAHGAVASATVVRDRDSGRSKGFAFVELDDADAENAIKELNGKDAEGRAMVVNVARPKEDRPQRSFRN